MKMHGRVLISLCALAHWVLLAGICDGPPAKPGANSPGRLNSLRSSDPNEIRGPLGMGAQRLVEPGAWMVYDIYFENKASATAAAQEVRVTLALDDALDCDTLEFGEIVLGPCLDDGLVGRHGGETSCRISGLAGLVKSAASVSGGIVTWYLRSWDEQTPDHFPADAVDGFLPPNDESGRGEGRVRFRVRVRADASPGATILASATIVFDDNDAIKTEPAWWNTVYGGGNDEIVGLLADEIASARDGDLLALPSGLPLSSVSVEGARLTALGRIFSANSNYVFEVVPAGIRVKIDRAAALIGSGVDASGSVVSAFALHGDAAQIGVKRTVRGFYYTVEGSPRLDFAESAVTEAVPGTGKALQLSAPKGDATRFYRVRVHDEVPARR